MAYIVISIYFVTKFILRTLLCNNTILPNFNFISKFEMYMEVKLNRTYIIEKKYFEILLRTTKNIFKIETIIYYTYKLIL